VVIIVSVVDKALDGLILYRVAYVYFLFLFPFSFSLFILLFFKLFQFLTSIYIKQDTSSHHIVPVLMVKVYARRVIGRIIMKTSTVNNLTLALPAPPSVGARGSSS
jgi:hypothetical protein